MKISDNGLSFIMKHEGLELESYLCPAGVWTIGVGHTGNIKKGMTITKEQAINYLKSDVTRFEKTINDFFKNKRLHQEQFDALVSLCFNLGPGAITNSRLGKRILGNEDQELIAKEWIEFCHIGRKTARGLLRRRAEEIAMFLSY